MHHELSYPAGPGSHSLATSSEALPPGLFKQIFFSALASGKVKAGVIKSMAFPVAVYGYESWTIKKAECQRIDAFELWCLEKTLESPLDSKATQSVHPKGNQS